MHVLMLGWEFPPFITGGLGTACHGLTKGLVQRGVKVTFVLPRSVATAESSHVELVSPEQPPQGIAKRKTGAAAAPATGAPASQAGRRTGARWIMVIDEHGEPRPVRIDVAMADEGGLEGVEFIGVPAASTDDPYASMDAEGRVITRSTGVPRPGTPVTLELPGPEPGTTIRRQVIAGEEIAPPAAAGSPAEPHAPSDASVTAPATGPEYGGDLFTQIERYANFCVEAAAGIDFDVIHAHDWMTFPAGLALARATGRPLVVHVHSTEFDRSGVNIHQAIYDVERRGMHGALRVVAVSQLTRNVIVSRYGMPRHLVEVVYNGVDLEPRRIGMTGIRRRDKIVLYFGRITYQKGPEYFVAAAKRVLEILEDVKFVVAGSGDMAQRMIELAAEMGIGHKMLFTGFLRGDDIKRVFSLADLYVMPSISEPFGIAPLEAMGHDVPVIISRTSGVSELVTHALKVDFWDVDDMANKIVAVLRHPPLGATLREHGAFEVRKITWDGAADRCEQVYRRVLESMALPTAR